MSVGAAVMDNVASSLKYVVVGIASFLLVANVAASVLRHAGIGLDKYDYLENKIDYAVRDRPDIVAIGPSFIGNGFNPAVFDAELAKRGISMRSLNFAAPGLGVPEMRYMLESLLARKPCCLRYAILSPCFECWQAPLEPDDIDSINFFTVAHAWEYIDFIRGFRRLPQDPPGWTSWTYATNILRSMMRHYTSLGLGRAAFRWPPAFGLGPDTRDPDFWRDAPPGDSRVTNPRGQGINRATMDAAKEGRYMAALSLSRSIHLTDIDKFIKALSVTRNSGQFSDDDFEDFAQLVSELTAHDVAVLIIQPPVVGTAGYEETALAMVRSRCGDQVPLIDYADTVRYENLFLPPSIRADGGHLNWNGSIVWSNVLADDFADHMQKGVFGRPTDCLLRPP